LAFTGATALIWSAGEAMGDTTHDVRWVAALRWLALLALSIALSRAWLRRGGPRSRGRFATLALVAFVLATSKIQHMLLPLGLGIVVLVLDRWRLGYTSWRAAALLVGALFGLYFQFVQTTREGLMMDAIRQYNRADVVFTGMLPFAGDPRALL